MEKMKRDRAKGETGPPSHGFSAKTTTNTERFFFTVKPESAQAVL
jgi:hypothetical protein